MPLTVVIACRAATFAIHIEAHRFIRELATRLYEFLKGRNGNVPHVPRNEMLLDWVPSRLEFLREFVRNHKGPIGDSMQRFTTRKSRPFRKAAA